MAPKAKPKFESVAVRLPAQIVETIDRLAPTIAAERWEGPQPTRSDVIRYLIRIGIEKMAKDGAK